MLPDKFRKRRTDCAIHLNMVMLLDDNIPISMSAAGVALIPVTIGIKYIDRAVLLQSPKLTLYSRPKAAQLAAAEGEDLHCRDCGLVHNRGVWWCLGCWEPLTWVGVDNRQAFLRDNTERHREFIERYCVTPADFHHIMMQPESAVSTLTKWRTARGPGVEPKLRAP